MKKIIIGLSIYFFIILIHVLLDDGGRMIKFNDSKDMPIILIDSRGNYVKRRLTQHNQIKVFSSNYNKINQEVKTLFEKEFDFYVQSIIELESGHYAILGEKKINIIHYQTGDLLNSYELSENYQHLKLSSLVENPSDDTLLLGGNDCYQECHGKVITLSNDLTEVLSEQIVENKIKHIYLFDESDLYMIDYENFLTKFSLDTKEREFRRGFQDPYSNFIVTEQYFAYIREKEFYKLYFNVYLCIIDKETGEYKEIDLKPRGRNKSSTLLKVNDGFIWISGDNVYGFNEKFKQVSHKNLKFLEKSGNAYVESIAITDDGYQLLFQLNNDTQDYIEYHIDGNYLKWSLIKSLFLNA